MIIFVESIAPGCQLVDPRYTPGAIFLVGMKERDERPKPIEKRKLLRRR